jgi:hypothetical protein
VSADNTSLIAYAGCLCPDCTLGTASPGYAAVEAVDTRGGTHYLLAECAAIGDERVTYDPTCSDVAHEQMGPLPIEYVRRLTIATRTHRCGRRTKAGAPCRTPVHRPGAACSWHRSERRATS